MPANWSTPKTWNAGELLTASDLNTYVRDNFDWLKSPPYAVYALKNLGANLTTISTTFTDADPINLSLTLVTAGGNVLVGFHGAISNAGAAQVYLDLTVDAIRQGETTSGLVHGYGTGIVFPVGMQFLATGLSVGSHTFRLQWRVAGSTGTLYKTGQFWAREV